MTRRNYRTLPVAHGRYLAEHIPSARFVELPGADSWPFVETPDLIMGHIEEFLTGARLGAEPDRVLAALLLTDIVDSTAQAAKLGDAAWRALLDRHDSILRDQVKLFGGTVVDHAGDGSLSTFGDSRRAIECALAVKSALNSIGIEIRTGIHFGEVERRDDGRLGGVAVHLGARVMGIAAPGEVLVSRTVRDVLIGSRYEFGDRGTHELKGVPGQWQLYSVVFP
jgi:class 3 adenylate cyclase